MRKFVLALAAAALTLPAAPAFADPPPWAPAHGKRAKDRAAIYGSYGGDYRRQSLYDPYGRYYEPRALTRADRVWQGSDGRYYCRRDNGTTGLIVGGAAGALLGRHLDGGRNRSGIL